MSVPTHPVQRGYKYEHERAVMPQSVTMQAYQVYKHLFGEQVALITGDCRGGFGVSELIAFLYAYPFPQSEWERRVDEALTGMKL